MKSLLAILAVLAVASYATELHYWDDPLEYGDYTWGYNMTAVRFDLSDFYPDSAGIVIDSIGLAIFLSNPLPYTERTIYINPTMPGDTLPPSGGSPITITIMYQFYQVYDLVPNVVINSGACWVALQQIQSGNQTYMWEESYFYPYDGHSYGRDGATWEELDDDLIITLIGDMTMDLEVSTWASIKVAF